MRKSFNCAKTFQNTVFMLGILYLTDYKPIRRHFLSKLILNKNQNLHEKNL